MRDYGNELQSALAAAGAAAEFIRAEYDTFTPIPNAPADISTHVDRGAQEIILTALRERFPSDGYCAEEGAVSAVGGGRVWVIDPIDGTRGFARKTGDFSIMVGLTDGGRPVVGVVWEPVAGRVTYASAGGGCWVKIGEGNETPSRVSENADPAALTLVQSWTKKGAGPTGPVAALHPATVLEMYSAGVKLALVARGGADVYANTYPDFRDWDICAGHILVEEAGGKVTGFRGEPITYGGPGFSQRSGLVATNGKVHAAVVGGLSGVALG